MLYHWEGVDEVAVDGVEGPRVVVGGRADRRQVNRLIFGCRSNKEQPAEVGNQSINLKC